jgi:hypothetical protein
VDFDYFKGNGSGLIFPGETLDDYVSRTVPSVIHQRQWHIQRNDPVAQLGDLMDFV